MVIRARGILASAARFHAFACLFLRNLCPPHELCINELLDSCQFIVKLWRCSLCQRQRNRAAGRDAHAIHMAGCYSKEGRR